VFTHGPADDFATIEIEEGSEIEPAFAGLDVGNIRDPNLIGARRARSPRQAVWCDRLVMIAIGRVDAVAGLLAAINTLLQHDAGDALAAMAMPSFAELLDQARTTIGPATLSMEFNHFAGE